jgi:hypothetical protein
MPEYRIHHRGTDLTVTDSRDAARMRRDLRAEADELDYDMIVEREEKIRGIYRAQGHDVRENSFLDRSIKADLSEVHMTRAHVLCIKLKRYSYGDAMAAVYFDELSNHSARLADIKGSPDKKQEMLNLFFNRIFGKKAAAKRRGEVSSRPKERVHPQCLLKRQRGHLKLVQG